MKVGKYRGENVCHVACATIQHAPQVLLRVGSAICKIAYLIPFPALLIDLQMIIIRIADTVKNIIVMHFT